MKYRKLSVVNLSELKRISLVKLVLFSFISNFVALCMFFAVRCVIITYIFYVIYIYVAVGIFCAVRCVIIICCYLSFYLQLCSWIYVLCSTLCNYYLLLFVILFTVM